MKNRERANESKAIIKNRKREREEGVKKESYNEEQ